MLSPCKGGAGSSVVISGCLYNGPIHYLSWHLSPHPGSRAKRHYDKVLRMPPLRFSGTDSEMFSLMAATPLLTNAEISRCLLLGGVDY